MSKRCPLCKNGSMRFETDFEHKRDKYHIIYARCPLCGARTASYPSMVTAESAWDEGKVTSGDLYQASIFEPVEANNG